jgi:hypothetical protein
VGRSREQRDQDIVQKHEVAVTMVGRVRACLLVLSPYSESLVRDRLGLNRMNSQISGVLVQDAGWLGAGHHPMGRAYSL